MRNYLRKKAGVNECDSIAESLIAFVQILEHRNSRGSLHGTSYIKTIIETKRLDLIDDFIE